MLNVLKHFTKITTRCKPDITNIAKRTHVVLGGLPSVSEPPKPEDRTKYIVSTDPEEWKWVERYLPQKVVPEPPTENKVYPSGWQPQTALPGDYSYFIKRTRNHVLPVYLKIKMRGMKRQTRILRIQGDIWKLADDLLEHLKAKAKTHRVMLKVHEISGEIRIYQDHVNVVKEWLLKKGF